jgi:hypothetical protein
MMIAKARSSHVPLRLEGRWLFLARLMWVVVLLLAVGKTAIGMPSYYAGINSICTASREDCRTSKSLNPQQAQALESAGLSLTAYAVLRMASKVITSIVWGGLGLAIFLLQPKDWMAFIASAMMIVFISSGYDSSILLAYPSLGTAAELIFDLGNILLFLFIGLFPNGRFSPRWMRWYWLGIVLLSIFPPPGGGDIYLGIFWLSFLLLGSYSLVYRYRKESAAVERQQTKLFVFGFAAFAGSVMASSALSNMLPEIGIGRLLVEHFLFDAAGLLIPMSIGFSILRYRLWDIDLIIRRTLVYTLLTACMALVYLGAVTLLQSLFQSVSGQSSTIAIVLSTLAIAALFNPLRNRIQAFIDRRFYRQKYNAEQALDQFASLARSETDLDMLTGQLVHMVKETVQPEQVRLWLTSKSKL